MRVLHAVELALCFSPALCWLRIKPVPVPCAASTLQAVSKVQALLHHNAQLVLPCAYLEFVVHTVIPQLQLLCRPAGDVYEHAVLVSLKSQNEDMQESAFTQLKTFYDDTR